jgi:peptidyl-prolyl cis-trans isomerase SurA
MKRKLVLVIAGLIAVNAFSQKKSPAILKIGKQNFGLDEFEFVYNKNNQLSQNPLTPNEYLDLFTNYKLKVTEAMHQGLDTTQSFTKEFNYYRDELAKPYLNDKKAEEKVMAEAYERLKYEVDASHILIRFPQSPTAADTLKAWNKISEVVAKLKNGESFELLAIQYSEDPSAQSNQGRLGYFTGFQMVYPFETAAYNTPVGQFSGIVRTQFGYHLLKIHDKRPASGEVLTAHIMKMFPYNSPESAQQKAKASIDSIYALVKSGADFGELAAKYSDDKQSAVNNGQMPWFGYGRMIPEYALPAFALQNNNDVSEPIKTPYGWHIIKRLDKRSIASFDDMKEEIKQRVASDERQYAGQDAVLKRIKADYNYIVNQQALDLIDSVLVKKGMTDSLFFAQTASMKAPVASFAKQTLTQDGFINYLKQQGTINVEQTAANFKNLFDSFSKQALLDYEKAQLLNREPEYRFLVNEYHDGLLIFEISQKEVWNKASSDTVGLQKFFDANKTNYQKPEKWEGIIYYCNNQDTYDRLNQYLSGGGELLPDSVLTAMGIKSGEIRYERVKVAKGENALIDNNFFGDNSKPVKYPYGYTTALTIGKIVPAGQAELNDVRGQVLSDYQNELEKKWITALRAKYKAKPSYKLTAKMKPAEKK